MEKKRKVYFRADGDKQIGWGHVMRMLAFMDILKRDFELFFIGRLDEELQKRVENKGCELVPVSYTHLTLPTICSV